MACSSSIYKLLKIPSAVVKSIQYVERNMRTIENLEQTSPKELLNTHLKTKKDLAKISNWCNAANIED